MSSSNPIRPGTSPERKQLRPIQGNTPTQSHVGPEVACIRRAGNFSGAWVVVLLAAILQLAAGCGDPSAAPLGNLADYRDSTISEPHSLGWLGGQSHPLNQALSISDPGNPTVSVSPGGIVLVVVDPERPLDAAGFQAGDVIVRVAEQWLPIKEDPTLDFIKAIENQINAKKDRIEVGYFRGAQFGTTHISANLPSLDEGLPLPVKRFSIAAWAALEQLAKLQLDDGSFAVDSNDPDGILSVTAMSGLAFFAGRQSDTDLFSVPRERCLDYLGQQIDARLAAGDGRLLDPLTAAFTAMFLAESDAPLNEIAWLERFGYLLESLVGSQQPSGGWHAPLSDDDPEKSAESAAVQTDVMGTFTTHQVLLALGALEHKGLSTDDQAIEKGLGWLREQTRLRIPSALDRRAKSILSAGTAAALVACNCDRNDGHLAELVQTALERASDVYTAPQLGVSGLFLTALAARQSGSESWLRFHDSIKHLAVSLQRPDGGIHSYPGINREPLEFEKRVAGEAWETAHVALVLSMQSKQLVRLLAIETPSAMALRDSSGKISTGTASVANDDADAKKKEAEELTKLILEQLREQGMEVDESDLKVQSKEKSDDK